MTDVTLIRGCPGGGKTRTLSHIAEQAGAEYGGRDIVICSLTKTAAAEIASRVTVPDGQVGTLHAHAYRALDRPDLAETPEGLKAWGADHPELRLTGGRGALDDLDAPSAIDDGGRTHADTLHQNVMNHRARMTPTEQWSEAERTYSAVWEEWKAETQRLDFTDLIERALREVPQHPAHPRTLLGDEAQDFSTLELALFRRWAANSERAILAADPLQVLYSWRGCNPDAFARIDEDHTKHLRQSYRLPRAVHEAAVGWARGNGLTVPDYRPRDAEGSVEASEVTAAYIEPLLDEIQAVAAEGKTVMLLTTCGYMLTPALRALRDAGIPFHNPLRCSPPDEPILTTNGWVPIGDLDPRAHRLAGYYGQTNALSWGGRSGPLRSAADCGFAFKVGSRPYIGPLLTLTTEASRTRVTPNHRVRVRFTKDFAKKWIVYLMRRGDRWRIGRSNGRGGLGSRLTSEWGDGIWVLGTFETKREAALMEARLQAEHGITGATFRAWGREGKEGDQAGLDELHKTLSPESGVRARRLLTDFGLLEEHPLYWLRTDGLKRMRVSARSSDSFETVAANVLSDYMTLPIPSKSFLIPACSRSRPEWKVVSVQRGHFHGLVYSLDVPGPEHYVSGGAVVHNSNRGAWNPLRAAGRLAAFLRPRADVWGAESRAWTWDDLRAWTEPLSAKDALARGGKSLIAEKCREDALGATRAQAEVPLETLAELLGCADNPMALRRHPAIRLDVDWWSSMLRANQRDRMAYPLKVLAAQGAGALRARPALTVGTVHSVKGGEASTVILSPELSKAAMWEGWHPAGPGRDHIVRTMYVGATRARDRLVVLAPSVPEHVPVDGLLGVAAVA